MNRTELTDREIEVAKLVADGLENTEIAIRLGITPGTVAQHMVNIFDKLRLRNRAELTEWTKLQAG